MKKFFELIHDNFEYICVLLFLILMMGFLGFLVVLSNNLKKETIEFCKLLKDDVKSCVNEKLK